MSQDGSGSGIDKKSRRKKFAGYLRAANEFRHSYQQTRLPFASGTGDTDEENLGIPGAFPEVAIARHGDDEMILFPSYALERKSKDKEWRQEVPGAAQDIRDPSGVGNADYWKIEWDRYEETNAIADVDVRGWIYSPHKGPMTRKNRLLFGIARHLSGVPTPPSRSQVGSRATSTHRERLDGTATRNEEEVVEREVQAISRRGRKEADIAWRGGYSEVPSRENDRESLGSRTSESRSPSPYRNKEPKRGSFPHQVTNTSMEAEPADLLDPGGLAKRSSWSHPSEMTPAELLVANAHLIARLKPFLTDPRIGLPLTIVFYNDQKSRSRTVMTNENGHFNIRAALDFIPTHVRVLATEHLSATEEVRITDLLGISVISDIDDTIKHSSIGSGAKEIFRNTFIRELSDLTIDGVKGWYKEMFDLGVKFHYVSNAPWQLYPVLRSYFVGAGLPTGSFHLKQYSGMLQGIFEPVAERKKGTLERIIGDFPQRKFILVGDSGEADLELYTDIVISNPGRILGVFIRDVTTPLTSGQFDPSARLSMSPVKTNKGLEAPKINDGNVSPLLLAQGFEKRPKLPPRAMSQPQNILATRSQASQIDTGDLMEFSNPGSYDLDTPAQGSKSDSGDPTAIGPPAANRPSLPSKPLSLRGTLSKKQPERSLNPKSSRKGPPPPPKPRRYSSGTQGPGQRSEPSPLSETQNTATGTRSSVRSKVASVYNALPSPVVYLTGGGSQSQKNSPVQPRPGGDPVRALSATETSFSARAPPPIPPRRNLSAYPSAITQHASHPSSVGWSSAGATLDGTAADGYKRTSPTTPASKKEELWRRRLTRAGEVLEDRGVSLVIWRIGSDAINEAKRLIEKEKTLREEGKQVLPKSKSR